MDNQLDIIELLETELARLLEWVRAAESRLAFILPLSTVMLGALAVLAPRISSWSVYSAIVSSFAVFFLVFSIIFAAIASFPRTIGPKGSLIYFGGIVALDLEQFSSAIDSLTRDKYESDLIKQCHRNAQIAQRKYTWVQRSMACLFISSAPWAISLFLLYSNKWIMTISDDLKSDVQTIITTHHPYLINAMPIESWQIMSRKGSHVTISRGDTRKEIYEASSQEAFTQLLNDPLYSDDWSI